MNAQNLQINSSQISGMDIVRTENSWKSNEISSTQDSDMNGSPVVWKNSPVTQESQSTQNSTTVEEEDDYSFARIDMKSKSIYFSDPVSSEYHLKVLSSVECRTPSTSLQNQSVDEILSGDALSGMSSLLSLETGITVTDMTAEVPTVPRTTSVFELDNLLEVDCPETEDKIGSAQDNTLMLKSKTATNGSSEVDLKTEYSITELKSSDTVSIMMDTNTDAIMQTDSTSGYKKCLSNNYSEFAITEATQQKKLDEIATAEISLLFYHQEVSSLSGTLITIDYEPVITELETYLNTN
uniref:Uncharacterized protein n=1 Tax=Wuchereria bancrofti TaxID=6293 RepID=A0AAF5PYQ4_WUCBA